MKKLLFGLLFSPLFLLGQNVEKIDASKFAKGSNLGTIATTGEGTYFTDILEVLKDKGLDFDLLDRKNGIITTRARIMKDLNAVSYSLKVYFEREKIQIRVFVTEETGKDFDYITGTKWYQAQNNGFRTGHQFGFKYLVYWINTIEQILQTKAVLSEENG